MLMPLVHLAEYAVKRGDLPQAEAHFREAFRLHAISRRVGETINAIEGLADVTHRQGRHQAAARLMGAATAGRAPLDITIWPTYQDELNTLSEGIRNSLGAEEFAMTWNEGAAMSLEEAIEYARLVTLPADSNIGDSNR
jgi:hypothetical protein